MADTHQGDVRQFNSVDYLDRSERKEKVQFSVGDVPFRCLPVPPAIAYLNLGRIAEKGNATGDVLLDTICMCLATGAQEKRFRAIVSREGQAAAIGILSTAVAELIDQYASSAASDV